MMKSPLHILHLEDDPNDALLVQATLEEHDINHLITLVYKKEEFVRVLEQGGVDLILSDFALPDFDGLAAMEIVRERWPDLPLIIVSGSVGEDFAIEALKSGAIDYVLKDRLSRLGPAVRRAMQEVEARAESRRLQSHFIEAQKMEVIGQLASGVAHDFNIILAVVMGNNDLLASELPSGSSLHSYTDEIQQAAVMGAGLTRQLLVFSSRQVVEPVLLELDAAIQRLENILRRLIDQKIELSIMPGARGDRIKADPGYLGQVLMNLVVNARDAMPRGGAITITTAISTVDGTGALAPPDITPGDYVVLSVADTGVGITPEVKARMFEAFFTTKPTGKGTGLGLATCQTIVQQSGGYIDVSSEPGQGATFRLYFPRVAQPASPEVAPEKALQWPLTS